MIKNKRTEDLRIRVSPEEKQRIEKAAGKTGQTVSAWLRMVALKWAKVGVVVAFLAGCYETRREMNAGPAEGEAMGDYVWNWYGRDDTRSFSLHWLAYPDCADTGFTSLQNGQCIDGEYYPALNRIYLINQQITYNRWSYFARVLCHEILHAVIDNENGVVFEGDTHVDDRFSDVVQITCRDDFDKTFYSAK